MLPRKQARLPAHHSENHSRIGSPSRNGLRLSCPPGAFPVSFLAEEAPACPFPGGRLFRLPKENPIPIPQNFFRFCRSGRLSGPLSRSDRQGTKKERAPSVRVLFSIKSGHKKIIENFKAELHEDCVRIAPSDFSQFVQNRRRNTERISRRFWAKWRKTKQGVQSRRRSLGGDALRSLFGAAPDKMDQQIYRQKEQHGAGEDPEHLPKADGGAEEVHVHGEAFPQALGGRRNGSGDLA